MISKFTPSVEILCLPRRKANNIRNISITHFTINLPQIYQVKRFIRPMYIYVQNASFHEREVLLGLNRKGSLVFNLKKNALSLVQQYYTGGAKCQMTFTHTYPHHHAVFAQASLACELLAALESEQFHILRSSSTRHDDTCLDELF